MLRSFLPGLVLAALAGPALAHISVEPAQAPAGASQVIRFRVGHGCDGKPTTGLRVELPPAPFGDWDEAARMLTDHALSLTLDGQAGTVVALLRSFPARVGADSPDLTLVRAIADQNQLRLDQTDAHLREVRAYAAIMPPASRHRLQMAIASVDLLSARLRGHFDNIFEQQELCWARATVKRAPTPRSAVT